MIVLTPVERVRFAIWCEEEAASKQGLMNVFKKQRHLGKTREAMVSRHNAERLACTVVAKLLRSIEPA